MSDHLPAPAATARLDHFEPFHFANNLPPDTRETLKAIFANWSDSEKTDALVRQIIDPVRGKPRRSGRGRIARTA